MKSIIIGVIIGSGIYVGGLLGVVAGLNMVHNVVEARYPYQADISFSDGKQILPNYPILSNNYNPQR